MHGWERRRHRTAGRPRRPQGPPHAAEALEPRQLLAITVDGTAGNDNLSVFRAGNDLHVTLNGSSRTIGIGNEFQLVVRGLAGNDNIDVGNMTFGSDALLCEVFGGDDNDTITEGSVLGASADRIHGGAGSDTVVLDDTGAAGARKYQMFAGLASGNTLVFVTTTEFGGSPNIVLDDDIQTLRLLGNDFGNTVDIQERPEMGVITYDVQTRGGDDTCTFTRAAGDGTGALDYDGGSGTDTLNYEDQFFGTGNLSFVVASNSLTRSGAALANWSNTQVVSLAVNGVNDAVRVDAVGTGIDVTVDAGAGDDVITVGDGDIDANIRGPLHLIGGNGTDRVSFSDTTGTTNDGYNLLISRLTKTGLADPIDYSAENCLLVCNGGDNAVSVAASNSTRDSVTVNGGGGDDVITCDVGAFTRTNSAISGGSGDDTVVYTESGNAADKDFIVSGGAVQWVTNGSADSLHSYTAETVTINAGAFDSSFTVASLGSATALNINAGDGADALSIAPFATTATITFAGQGGTDSISVDDSANPSTLAMTYTLEKASFDMTNFGLLNFGTVEALTLRLSDGGDVVNVNGILGGVTTTINGGFDPDTFNVGNGDIDTNISFHLSIQGNQGGDRLVLNDSADTGDDGYNFTNGVFTKGNVGITITYNTLEHVELNANTGNNAITFVSPGFALDATLRGLAGADTFVVTPSARASVAAEGSDPTVAPGDVLRFVNAAAAGSATLTPNGPVNGTYTFAAAQPVAFTGIETFPTPPGAPEAPDLADADDSGVSKVDNVTRVVAPLFSGKGPAKQKIELRAAGATLGSDTIEDTGAYSFRATFPADGVYALQAFSLEPVSGLTGAASPPLSVTIDTAAPAAPAAAPDMSAASDSGISSTDNVTNVTRPVFTGLVPADLIVRLRAGVVPLGSDLSTAAGIYSITTGLLADGVRNAAVTFEDLAGNVSPAGPSLAFTLDTVAPAAPAAAPDLLGSSDTGASNSDNVTRDATPQFVEAVPGGAIVRLFDGATEVGIDANTAGGLYDITTSPLADGTASIAARFEDLAGNFAASGPALSVTIDTQAPAVAGTSFDSSNDRLAFAFSEDVGGVPAGNLTVTPSGGSPIPAGAIAAGYVPNTATFTFPGFPGGRLPAASYHASLSNAGIADVAGNAFVAATFIDFTAFAAVAGRMLFYNNSSLDGADPSATAADDAAIATDKQALLPGQAASFANVSAFSRGINGIMIDLAGLPAGAAPAAGDFIVETGDGATWAPVPAAPAVSVRRGAGASGTDRLTLLLPDGAAANTWLRVTLSSGPRTGLAVADAFYFGSLVGDAGNNAAAPAVNVSDLVLTRAASGRTDAPALNRFDFNRDGRIDVADVMVVRLNQRRALPPFTAPAAVAPTAVLSPARRLVRPVEGPSRRGLLGEPPIPLA